MAIRPHTLPAAISPVLVAWSIAWQQEQFILLPALAALLVSLLVQIISNLVNDVMDYYKGADTEKRTGFQRVTQSGLLSPKEVWAGVVLCILLAGAAGGYIIWLRGSWALALGIFSILSAIAYTAGPFPLAYNGFADIFVFIFFGLVNLCGSVFAIMGNVPAISWLAAANMGALITTILVVNNIRDRESDRLAGRRNIVVLFGKNTALWEYRILTILPYLSLIAAALWTQNWRLLLPWLTAVEAIKLNKALAVEDGAALNPVLGRTAQFVLHYGLLLAIGFLLG